MAECSAEVGWVVVQDFLEAVVVFPADLECFLFLVGMSEELWTRSAVDA
jgi:hypothetical protein